MKTKEQLYRKICEIADQMHQNGEQISRSDLAFVLRKEGFDCQDDNNLSKDIYDAYQAQGKPESIVKAIVGNNKDKSIVDQYELNAVAESGRQENALDLMIKDLRETTIQMDKTRDELADVLRVELAHMSHELMDFFKGDAELKQLKEESAQLMLNYGRMIDQYKSAEDSVKTNIHDFVVLRSNVNNLFMKYANTLVDIFGEGIKVVAPQLFDFDKVTWLDVDTMKNNVEMEYTRLDEKCTLLLGEIAQNFGQAIDRNKRLMETELRGMKLLTASGKTTSASTLGAGLLIAAFDMMSHRIDAGRKTVMMQNEQTKLKGSIMKDKSLIEADLMRLATIYKTLNDIYMPRAEAFGRLSKSVMGERVEQIAESLYTTPELKELKNQRDTLVDQLRRLEQEIADHEENISLFEKQIGNDKGMLQTQKQRYDEAMDTKPSKPNAIINIVSIGTAKSRYAQKLTDWMKEYGELANEYENLEMDVKEFEEDLKSHKQGLEKAEKEYAEAKRRLKETNQKMQDKLKSDTEAKKKALPYLNDMIRLLYTAKQICESKLDDSLLNPVSLSSDNDLTKIPDMIDRKLKDFGDEIHAELEKEANEGQDKKGMGDADAALAKTIMDCGDNIVSLIENWGYLQTEEMRQRMTKDAYDEQIGKLKVAFKETMDKIDNQSEALMQALRKANNATSTDQLSKALCELSDNKALQLSEKELTEIMNGTRHIEI